jgi:DNA-binding NarL/FixJ family response regulator
VLKLASAGLLNKQIGDKMKLSEVTVQIHRRIVMHTLGAKSLPDWSG